MFAVAIFCLSLLPASLLVKNSERLSWTNYLLNKIDIPESERFLVQRFIYCYQGILRFVRILVRTEECKRQKNVQKPEETDNVPPRGSFFWFYATKYIL
jgi:hypothetical protein